MPTVDQIPVRLELITRSNPPVPPIDLNTDELPRIFANGDVNFKVGIFDGNEVSVNLANLRYLQIDLRDSAESGADNLVSKTVTASEITNVISRAGWLDGDEQNAVFNFTPSDTNQNLGGCKSARFWLVVHGLTYSGQVVIYGAGYIDIYQSGAQGTYLPTGYAPLVVPYNTTWIVPENAQIPFHLPITVDGQVVIDGQLVEV